MKTKVIFFSLLLIGFNGYSQSANDYLEIAREVLHTEKKAVIAEVMQLNDAESTPFWSLYSEYQSKMYLVQNQRVAIIKEYALHYDNLTNLKADELYTAVLSYEGELLKLRKSYYKKFKKIIPAGKAAKFFQAENKIAAMIDAELAVDIPLIETN